MSYEVLQLALFTNDIDRVSPIKKIVSPLGWQLIAAVMQKQPIQWIHEQKVELILIDLDMPSSIHLTGSLSRCQPNVPILAVTSAESLDKVHDAMTAGATDFITYPVNAKHLMAALHRAIGERSTTVSNIIPIFDDMPDTPAGQNGAGQNGTLENGTSKSHQQIAATHSDLERAKVSIAPEPIVAEPIVAEPVVAEPVAEKPVVAEAVVAELVTAENGNNNFIESDTLAEELDAFVEQADLASISQKAMSMSNNAVSNNAVAGAVAGAVASGAVASKAISHNALADAMVPNVSIESKQVEKALATQNESMPSQSMPSQSMPSQSMPSTDHIGTTHRMPPADTPVEPAANSVQQAPRRSTVQPASPARSQRVDNSGMHFQPTGSFTSVQPAAHGMTTAVVSLRGGIGRSTIATNLAIALAKKEAGSVNLVEAHHGLSNLSLMLHLHPQRTLATIENEHTIDHDIVRGYLQQHTSGVNVLSAPTEIDEMVELAPETWDHLLNICIGLSTHTIIDTAAAADSALTEVLMKADEILIVTDPDIASLRSATALYQNVYAEPSINGQLHLVINRNGINGGLDEKTIQKQIGHEAVATLPYDPSLTTYAMNRGIPFVQSHPRALLSKRMHELAEKLLESTLASGHPTAEKKPATKSSFMSFLGR